MRLVLSWLLWAGALGCSGGDVEPRPGTGGTGGAGAQGGTGGVAGSAGKSAATVSFARDVMPLLDECTYCHFRGSVVPFQFQDPFDPVTGIVNVRGDWLEADHPILVVPGRPEQSFLMDKLRGNDLDEHTEGSKMPLSMPLPTEAEVAAVRTWIEAGANDDDQFRSAVAPFFGNAADLGRSAGKCSFCHTASSPYPPNLVDPFDAIRGVVNVAAASSGTRVIPGNPDDSLLFRKVANMNLSPVQGERMPFQATELSEAQITTVETWIREGALDN
jgi:hypothetical protein